jgi:SAM-dependent methyltransferase
LFPESGVVHRYLDGLRGLEIGGSAHNAFGVDTLNVDYTDDLTTIFKLEEIRLCGEAMTVDIVGNGDAIPRPDKSVDFVLSSHVIEHFWDPIRALEEWRRLARKYIVIICPQRDALESDINRPLTDLYELQQRHTGQIPPPAVDTHEHYTRWTSATFCQLCKFLGFEILEVVDPDDKVGNGFLVVLQA